MHQEKKILHTYRYAQGTTLTEASPRRDIKEKRHTKNKQKKKKGTWETVVMSVQWQGAVGVVVVVVVEGKKRVNIKLQLFSSAAKALEIWKYNINWVG